MSDYGMGGPKRPLVWRILLWPFTMLGALFGRFSTGDELQGVNGPLGWLKLIFVNPFVWMSKTAASLLVHWSASRSFRSFVGGMPAFLFALGIVICVVAGLLQQERFAMVYNRDYIKATRAAERDPEQYQVAELYLNRLIRLSPENREQNQIKKAELLWSQKKTRESAEILRRHADPNATGNPMAHFYLGQYYLGEEFHKDQGIEEMSVQERMVFLHESRLLATQHFEQALRSSPTEETAYMTHVFLYRLYTQRRQFEKAEPHLSYISNITPAFATEIYEFYTKRIPRPRTAEDLATRDSRRMKETLQNRPDNLELWKLYIRLHLLRGQYREALQELAWGIETATQIQSKAILRRFQSDVLFEQAMSMVDTTRVDNQINRLPRLTLLSEAVRINPENRRAVEQLVVLGFPLTADDSDQWLYDAKASAAPGSPLFYGVNMLLGLRALFDNQSDQAGQYLATAAELGPEFQLVLRALTMAIDPEAKSMLESLADNTGSTGDPAAQRSDEASMSTAPALFGIYMILGSRAVVEKEYDRGLDFFQKASQANPRSTTALNNVAYCMINRTGATRVDYEQALILASSIIQAAPQIPNFYETRGAIHLKLEDYPAAISDFEKALAAGFQNRSMVHRNLVIACRAAGRDAEADAYQRMVDEMPADDSVPISQPRAPLPNLESGIDGRVDPTESDEGTQDGAAAEQVESDAEAL